MTSVPAAPTARRASPSRIPSVNPQLPPDTTDACLCVLASGSRGNCSVVAFTHEKQRWAILLDCGLSPRHTYSALKAVGIGPSHIAGVVLTHLDHDHFKPAWVRSMPRHVPVYIHRAHRSRAQRQNFFTPSSLLYDEAFDLSAGRFGVRIEPTLLAHDQLGVAAFRVSLPNSATLGYATDLGHPTDQLRTHLHGVDVLAVESNYCPALQARSERPAFLKDRIMGGSGHLSNQQAADLTRSIAPREHVVLLHLSRDCNTPELAAQGHADQPYALTISDQFVPTPWVSIEPARAATTSPSA